MAKYLSSLQTGDKVRFGKFFSVPVSWIIADKNHKGYPSNSATLLAEKVVMMGAYDAREPYNSYDDCSRYGNSRYSLSNIHQFLNKDAARLQWWKGSHVTDHSPSSGFVNYDPYTGRNAFLYEFDQQEKDMLMDTDRALFYYSGTGSQAKEQLTAKVFLLTTAEVGINTVTDSSISGYQLEWLKVAANRICSMTEQAAANAQNQSNFTPSANYACPWWLAAPETSAPCNVFYVNSVGKRATSTAYSSCGIRPACNLPLSTRITDEPDEDGYYNVVVNYAPTVPAGITLAKDSDTLEEDYIRANRQVTISWGRSTDPDDNFDHYELERSYGGDYETIYSGTSRTFKDVAKYGEESVRYRVRAVDYYGLASEYVTSGALTIWSNEPPTIEIANPTLGEFGMTPPTIEYTYSDPDKKDVEITVFLDGVQHFKTTAGTGETPVETEYTFPADAWLKVLNGTHVVRITVKDDYGESVTGIATFTKKVDKILFERMIPVPAAEQATELILRVNGEIPDDVGLFKVEVTNNANDETPTWEDMTEAVLEEEIYEFTNTSKTADDWGVNIRVTVERGDSTEDIYIDSVTCNFLAGESKTSNRNRITVTTEENSAGGQTLVIEG